MPPDRIWSTRYNKPEIKLTTREIEWKNLMNECLMGTEIFKKCHDESEKTSSVDPNSVMDLRHRMAKQTTKIFCMPQIQTHVEALKLLRMRNYNIKLKQKEGKMVEKEIAKLKQTLESERVLMQTKINEATNKRTKIPPDVPKFIKHYAKQWKKLELCDGVCEVDTWVSDSVQMTMETKINQQGIPFDVKVSLKRQEESLEPAPTLERSIITDEVECMGPFSGPDEGKNEVMRRFFGNSTELTGNNLKDFKKDENVKQIPDIENKINLRLIRNAWITWRVYTQQLKNRKREKVIYRNKIDKFLSKLKEREVGEERGNTKYKHEIRIKCGVEDMTKNREKQIMNGEKHKHIKRLMEEVKTSQAEAFQTLQVLSRANLGNVDKFPNLKFLKRMEERREERLKRWKEIQEKKLKLEKEKQNAQKLKEEEKKQKEEENRRKKLEESKERRKLWEEKKKELGQKMKLAEDYYKKFLLHTYGLRPWFTLIKIRDSQQQQALAFYERRLTREIFHRLLSSAREQIRLKVSRANEFHERILKKNFLQIWLEFHKENMEQDQVASDWSELKITERAFKKWLQFTQDEQLEYLDKKEKALLHYEMKLKMKYLKNLRDYPEFKKLERAKENRKRKWRQRIRDILPDYQPVEIPLDCCTSPA